MLVALRSSPSVNLRDSIEQCKKQNECDLRKVYFSKVIFVLFFIGRKPATELKRSGSEGALRINNLDESPQSIILFHFLAGVTVCIYYKSKLPVDKLSLGSRYIVIIKIPVGFQVIKQSIFNYLEYARNSFH